MSNPSLRLSTILNKPLALDHSRASELRSELVSHGPHATIVAQSPQAMSGFEDSESSFFYWGVPLRIEGNVGIIPITGLLLSGPGGFLYPYCSFYEDIRARIDDALDDSRIKAIALWIDSPGGDVSQCLELSDTIAQARRRKPIVAIVYNSANSAAYALACATDIITVPETGMVGSIGVIMIHADYSEMLQNKGVKTTVFRFGRHKAELQEVEPLTPEIINREQAIVNALGEKFVALVARNRGLDEGTIRAMEGEAYLGERGVALGLADAAMPPHQALDDLIEQFS